MLLAMPFINAHLISIPQHHDNITGNCFCENCRERRLAAAMNEPAQARFGHFQVLDTLPQRENECLDRLFSSTIKQIVYGRAYKQTALSVSGFRYFKSWAKNQPQFRGYSDKQMEKLSKRVNRCAAVFDQWHTISRNLADPRITEIDGCRFSINQFYEARRMDWCLSYNEILRQKGKKVDNAAYTDDKFNDVFNYIVQSGILRDIGYQENLAASLGEHLKMRMIAHCKRRPNPY